MRQNRIKPDHQDTWHHCFNRISGTSLEHPFTDADKEQFIRILKRVSLLYTVKVVAFQVLGNHFHILLQAPSVEPGERETCDRFKAFHKDKRVLYPGSKKCKDWQMRLRDISWFMRHLQQLFTGWYNRTRPNPRRGSLWGGRFKNTILEDGMAVWRCWNYIECNALRANLVAHPADYRFGSYGQWIQSGHHPFQQNLEELLLPMLSSILDVTTLEDLKVEIEQKILQVISSEVDTESPSSIVTQRVRYWTDGLVIGSELFIRDVMSRFRSKEQAKQHRLAYMRNQREPDKLYAWRRLRV